MQTDIDSSEQDQLLSDYSQSRPLLQETTEESEDETISLPSSSTPTTNLDIISWSLISLAAEPFLVSVIGTYTPILLEQLARNNGVQLIDKKTPCVTPNAPEPIPQPPPPGLNYTMLGIPNNACVLPIYGGKWYIDTSSYALYTFSVSVLLQTICVITISGIADKGNYKKPLLLLSSVIGSISTISFIFITNKNYYMASLLAILANCAFGCVNVIMNSYLTILIKNYPIKDPANVNQIGKVSSFISGCGTGIGYSSALIVQISSMFGIMKLKDIVGGNPETGMVWALRVVISFVGIWWLIWQIPISILLKPKGKTHNDETIWQMVIDGYKDLISAIERVKELRDVSTFLVGWFILSDSITTINSTAILFVKNDLGMNMVGLSKVGILVMVSAIFGSFLIPNIIMKRFQIDIKTVMIGVIIWVFIVPLYGILGFFINKIGLHKEWEMYLLAIWYGIGLGGMSTISRSVYSMIIPKGKESIFFALFSITDKGSSIVGPLLVGLVVDKWHEIRYCFWVLGLLLLISMPIFKYGINLDRGISEAKVYR